VLHRTGIEPV